MNTNKRTCKFLPLVYVAGAYKGDTVTNIAKAEAVSIALIKNGWNVFTPHKNSSGYEKYECDELKEQTWIAMGLGTLVRCDVLYVMNNWRESRGTHGEILFASTHGIPIFWEERISPKDFKADNW